MSVEEQLGVADMAQGLAEAGQLWQDWVEHDPRLASAPAVDGLRDWSMRVGIDAADEVLHALVQIGSPSEEIVGQRRGSWLGRCCPARRLQRNWSDSLTARRRAIRSSSKSCTFT